jgi:PAS domain S-box-containing protein
MFAFRELSLRTQLLVLAILLVFPSLGIFTLHGLEMRKDNLKAAVDETRKLADNITSVQEQLTHEAKQFGRLIAELPDVKRHNIPNVQSFLAVVLKNNPQFLNIVISDRTGNVWATAAPSSRPVSLVDRRYFKNALASYSFSSGEYAIGKTTGKPSLAMGYPLFNERGEFDGVIALSFNLDQLKSLLALSQLPKDTNYVITDHKGIILSSGHGGAGLIGLGIRPETVKYMEDGPDTRTTDTSVTPDGDKRILSYRKLWLSGEEEPYLYVLTDSSIRTAVAKVDHVLLHNFELFVPFLVIAFAFAFYIGKRSIVDRVSILETAARQLAQGSLPGKIADLVKGGELGSLGHTFDDMAHQLDVRGRSLQESEQRFRSFVENANDIVFALAPTGVFTYVSPNWTEAFGHDVSEVIGEPFAPFVHPDDVPGCHAFLKLVIETGEKKSGVEYRVRHKNGRWVWYRANGSLIRHADGNLVSFIGIGRDISELKQTEEALRQSAEEIRDLYDHAPCGYHSLNKDGVFVRINDTALNWLGYSRDEVIGVKRFTDLLTPEGLETFAVNFSRFKATGSVRDLEFDLIRKDGTILQVLLNATAIVDANGDFMKSRSVMHDISELKRSEELLRQAHEELEQRVVERTAELARTVARLMSEIAARTAIEELLRESESLLRATFDNAPFELWVRDKQGYCIMQNAQLVRHWGSQLGLRPEDAAVARETQEIWQANNRRAFSGKTIRGEVEYIVDGEKRIYENIVVPIRTTEEIRAVLGINLDITERKQRENALRTSDERLSLALAASRMGVWEWNIPSNAIFWSPECYDIFGVKNFDGTLESFVNTLHHDDVAEVLSTALRALSEFTDYSIEFRISGYDGKIRWFRSMGRATYGEDGEPLRLTSMVQDITERKQAENDLRDYARRLIEIEEELRKKLAMELHDEIGRDLTVLGINFSIIGDTLSHSAKKKLGARMKDSGRLIEEISRTTRNIMSSLRPPVLDDYGLSAAINWHAALFSERTGIHVYVVADDPFPRFMAEKEMALFRITQEALVNIVKHAAAQNVTITLRRDSSMVFLSIIDDGKGCVPKPGPPELATSGRGLTIMRERAELFGGTFYMESSPSEGTRVCIEIYAGGFTDEGRNTYS